MGIGMTQTQDSPNLKHYRRVRKLLPKQATFVQSAKPEVLYSGAWGAGKSQALCEKILLLCNRYPGNRIGLFRKDLVSLRATTLVTLLEGDNASGPVLHPEFITSHNKTERRIILTNGSQIIYGGVENLNWVRSLNLGGAAIDQAEELSEQEYETVAGRMRLPIPKVRQLFSVCNPDAETHFLYKRFFLDKEPTREMVQTNTFENIYLPPDYIARVSRLKGLFYQRFVLGEWVSAEGIVYPMFNPTRHIVRRFEIPEDWEMYRTIDFGFTNPLVVQWWARPPITDNVRPQDRNWHMVHELYVTQRTIPSITPDILRINRSYPPVRLTVRDWDAEDGAILEHEGISSIPAKKSLIRGIQVVSQMIGENRIYFFEDALDFVDEALANANLPVSTVQEFGTYHWQRHQSGPDPSNPSEEPRGKDDHGMDATRMLFDTMAFRERWSLPITYVEAPTTIGPARGRFPTTMVKGPTFGRMMVGQRGTTRWK